MEEFKDEIKMKKEERRKDDLNMLNMIESRIMEIIQIEDECKRKLPKLYNQRLPRFMRRRAACHDARRLPRKMRPTTPTAYGSKSRKSLMRFRCRTRFQKHKRILRKYTKSKYKEPNKCLLHKWFAKRFKMIDNGLLEHVPYHNNTKNQRNLYRQTRYACAYLSMAHLIPIQLTFNYPNDSWQFDNILEKLNQQLTTCIAGFTFCASAIKQGRYEVGVHLYKPNKSPREYVCLAFAQLGNSQYEGDGKQTRLTLWLPRDKCQEIYSYLEKISKESPAEIFNLKKIHPRDWIRLRLVGPDAREESLKLAADPDLHKSAIADADLRLTNPSFGISIGRYIEEKFACFTYYNTYPNSVDIVLKKANGRMLWHKLIKNKAHLVGGYRDLERLLVADCFNITPDF